MIFGYKYTVLLASVHDTTFESRNENCPIIAIARLGLSHPVHH